MKSDGYALGVATEERGIKTKKKRGKKGRKKKRTMHKMKYSF